MKKQLCILSLLLGFGSLAQAQVHFDSGSARPNNPEQATRDVAHKSVVKHRRTGVRCADGAISYSRQNTCRGHRGIAVASNARSNQAR